MLNYAGRMVHSMIMRSAIWALAPLLVMAVLVAGSGEAQAAFSNWSSMGPAGGKVSALAVNPSKRLEVLVGGQAAIFKSISSANSWTMSHAGSQVSALAYDPANQNIAYSGRQDGVWKTVDGGTNWAFLAGSPATKAFAVDPLTPATLYAVGNTSIMKSTDGGASWNPTGAISNPSTIAIDKTSTNIVYAGTTGGGIFRSSDGGATWTAINGSGLGSLFVNGIAVDPVTASILTIATSGGIYRSTDTGVTWTQDASGFFSVSSAVLIAQDQLTPAFLYTCVIGNGPSGLYKSSDSGVSWVPVIGMSGGCDAIAIDPVISAIVYVGRADGVTKSTDRFATTVTPANANTGLVMTSIPSLAVDPVSPQTIYAGGLFGQIYKSFDGAATWGNIPLPGPASDVSVLAIVPATTNIYAGTTGSSSGVFYSSNSGAGWTQENTGLTNASIQGIAIGPDAMLDTYMAVYSDGVYKNNGSVAPVWGLTAGNVDITNTNMSAIVSDGIAGHAYAATSGGGIFMTTDGGALWTTPATPPTNSLIYSLAASKSTPGVLLAGSSGPAYLTTDSGTTWTPTGAGPSNITALAIHPGNSSVALAGTANGGVYITADQGGSWQPVTAGIPSAGPGVFAGVASIAFDGQAPPNAYIGFKGLGVYKRAISPFFSISPSSMSFGSIATGTTATVTVSVANSGSLPMNVTFGAMAAPYSPAASAVNPCPSLTAAFQLAPGASCNLDIACSPSAVGSFPGTFLISSDAPGSPHLFTLNASAVNPPPANVFRQVSGVANYTGATRAFITVATGMRGPVGTSVASGPGAYQINGVPAGVFPLFAFVDTHGTGTPHHSDPYFTGSVDTTTADAVLNINFTTPTPTAPVTPAWIDLSPTDGGGVVQWDMPLDSNLSEMADSYSIYWSTTPNPGPGNTVGGGSKTVVAGMDNHLILSGLTNGLDYFITATAWNGSTESVPAPVAGPVRIGIATAGVSVTGTVNFSGFTPGGPLYVVLENDKFSRSTHAAMVSAPSAPQAFMISGVPDGGYRLFAFIDQNNNQVLDDGDYRVGDDQGGIVLVSGNPVSGVSLIISASNAVATVKTNHHKNPSVPFDGYTLDFRVESNAKRVVSASLVTGPFVIGQVDLGTFKGDALQSWLSLPAGDIPALGAAYTINVTYNDGSTEVLTTTVSGVLGDFAVPQSPAANSTVTSGPVFSWSAPVPAPSYSYTYSLRLQDATGMPLWQNDSLLLPSQLSSPYNFDQSAQPALLVNGQSYRWSIVIRDGNGNTSNIETPFTFNDTTPATVLSVTPAAGTTNIALNSDVRAAFSDAMDWSSLNGLTFTLNNGATGKVFYDSFSRTAIFKPMAQLAPGTTYTATIAASVRDLAGNPLAAAYSWNFTTGASVQVITGSNGITTTPVRVQLSGAKIDLPAGTQLKDAAGNPLAGALDLGVATRATKADLPVVAQMGHLTDGSSLKAIGASVDIVISSSAGQVKTITPFMIVNLAVPPAFAAPGTTIPYYSFDGTNWNLEGTATVKADGTVDITVTHLSLWAIAQFQLYPNGILITAAGKTVPDISDALQALRIAVGLDSATAAELGSGDVAPLSGGLPAPDGSITVGDAMIILQKALGIVNW